MIGIPKTVEEHPLWVLVVGFVLGISAIPVALAFFGLEVEPELSTCSSGKAGLRIETTPETAEIAILGQEEFYQSICLPSGRYKVVVTASGYRSQERTISVSRADHLEIFSLEPIVIIDLLPITESEFTGDRLTLNFNTIAISSVVQILAEVADRNIIFTGDMYRSITLRVKNVPWDEVLEVIARSNGLNIHDTGNIIVITDAVPSE